MIKTSSSLRYLRSEREVSKERERKRRYSPDLDKLLGKKKRRK